MANLDGLQVSVTIVICTPSFLVEALYIVAFVVGSLLVTIVIVVTVLALCCCKRTAVAVC